MSQSSELFSNAVAVVEVDKKQSVGAKKIQHTWRFVTNQMNMAYMLGSGLIMPPSGFGQKYYQDTLQLMPNWIPLFPKAVSVEALAYVVAEQPKQLNACYVELDLSGVSCSAWRYASEQWQQIKFPEALDGTEELLLLPAPLPISLIKHNIVFAEAEHAKAFTHSFNDYGNAELTPLKASTKKPEFNKKKTLPWPLAIPETISLQPLQIDLPAVNAIGGAVAALAIFSQSNGFAKVAYQAISGRSNTQKAEESQFKLLNIMTDWAYSIETDNTSKDTFALLVQRLYENIGSSDYGSALDIILAHFTEISEIVFPGHQSALSNAKELMQLISENARTPQDTLENLLKEHDKPLQQVLLSFVFRERLEDLWLYPLPIQPERVADVALLAGLREGWMNLDRLFKQQQRCNTFVPSLMAMLAHRFAGTDMVLPKIDAPFLLSEYFSTENWSKSRQDAAVYLAKKQKWACVTTRISLGRGDYQLSVGASGVDLVLDGEVKAVRTEVDRVVFDAALAQLPILDPKLDAELRKLLGTKP
ncbi:MAG TPA: hypothetical protein VJY63_06530 [Marinospirillum sp.]|uniref:hypothetical protein n=1 Tax=Marinospirillum sp. TaxID=2183934 RepID=UPI002B45C757|nr:hypothetical protein [Marinospirillum sp.]HKM15560.1 hypothetical protein [Marinospirillum sp.]